jgi:hypothetical protein
VQSAVLPELESPNSPPHHNVKVFPMRGNYIALDSYTFQRNGARRVPYKFLKATPDIFRLDKRNPFLMSLPVYNNAEMVAICSK